MKKLLLATFCTALLGANAAVAQPAVNDPTVNSRYSYAGINFVPWQSFDVKGDDDTAIGGGFNLSWHFASPLYFIGRTNVTAPDDGDTFVGASVGFGVRSHIADLLKNAPKAGNLDAYTQITYEHFSYSTSTTIQGTKVDGDLTGDGIGVTLGFRFLAGQHFEINPYGGYINYFKPHAEISSNQGSISGSGDDDLDGARYGIRLVYDVSDQLALLAAFDRRQLSSDDLDDINVNTASVGLRWYYPSSGLPGR